MLSFARTLLPGVILAVLLAAVAKLFAGALAAGSLGFPKFPLSPVLCAVLIGMLWRNVLGVPAATLEGLNWTMRALLRLGIALVGLRLTLKGAGAIAGIALPVAVACISIALIAGTVISRWFGVPKALATLLAVGTAVCGCTAVIAVSPLIRARSIDTAFAVACVVLFGCVAMLCYPWIAAHFFPGSATHAGIFLGTAIHDTSQVIGAGMIYSQQMNAPDALAAASVTKLLRNLSMAVLLPAAAWWMRKQEPSEDGPAVKTDLVPLFVIGFILFIVLRTAGDAVFGTAAGWSAAVNAGQSLSDLLLVCALAAVGLSVSFSQLWNVGWKPLAAAFLIAVLVGACSLALTLIL